jgi:hypothetical protein
VFDEGLLDLVAETLEEEGDGSAGDRLAGRRRDEWSVQSCAERVDLLASVWTHLADRSLPNDVARGPSAHQPRGWYRAYTPASRFPLISAHVGAPGIHVELTCRQPRFFQPRGCGQLRSPRPGRRIASSCLHGTCVQA